MAAVADQSSDHTNRRPDIHAVYLTHSWQSGSPRPGCTTGWQMSEYPGFGVLLARLLDRRELDARSLPGTDSEKGELRVALAGAVPGRPLLRRLSAALGMRVPDLYLVAGMEVPPDDERLQGCSKYL